ncbi:MAG: hypothetical protein ABIN99_10320 [Nitrosospira sp.]|jgi:hypothetical protein
MYIKGLRADYYRCGRVDHPYKNPPTGLGESELLVLATQHDPIPVDNFKNYKVSVRREARHSVVLVCDASGTWALLENIGCS